VTIRWFDRSTDEQKFVLYKRDLQGTWREIYEVPTRDMTGYSGDYSYVDTDRSISGQCYMLAAAGPNGSGYAGEQCTVRPDPSRFPQTPPPAMRQWYGLNDVNDGTGDLFSNVRPPSDGELTHANQTFGVDLDWTEQPGLWKAEAQGGPQLMHGQAVALRVWGGGWLRYGHEDWGVDLELSSTPSYEWYVLGGVPGTPLDGSEFALWNSAAGDYLIASHQTWGVGLNWYRKTLPAPPPPPPPSHGVKTLVAYNCVGEQRPLEMWVSDLSAGGGWTDMGRLDSQWSGSDCPATGQPWTFSPSASGHRYEVRAVDFDAPRCSDDPTIADCWRSDTTFLSDTSGQVVTNTIG
jgi:hypothetical protein